MNSDTHLIKKQECQARLEIARVFFAEGYKKGVADIIFSPEVRVTPSTSQPLSSALLDFADQTDGESVISIKRKLDVDFEPLTQEKLDIFMAVSEFVND